MASWKERKCRYFDPYTGDLIGPDCTRGSKGCKFIHPGDPEWDSNRYRARSRSPIRGKRHSRSLSPRRRRSPTPPRRRDSSQASRFASRRGSDTFDPHKGPSGIASNSDPQSLRPATPVNSQPTTTSSTIAMPPRSMPPPPLPHHPPVHPPPAPSTRLIRNEKEPTNGKRKIWLNRVKLMTDCCAARAQVLKWELELRRAENSMKSDGFQTLGADAKKNVEEKRSHSLSQRDFHKGELNDALYKLLEMDDSWPESTQSNQEAFSNALRELQNEVSQLKALADSLQDNHGASQSTPDEPTTGKKRRRLSTDDGHIISEKKWEELQDKFEALEIRIADQQNEVIQSEENILADLYEVIDEKIAELTNTWEDTSGHLRSKLEKLVSSFKEQPSKIAEIVQSLEKTEVIISGLKDENLQLKDNTTELEKRSAKLQEEQHELGAVMAWWENQQIENDGSIHRLERESGAMSATQTALLAQPGPPLPPTLDQILEVIEEPLKERLRAAIEPLLQTHRAEVRAMLLNHNERICTEIWNKLTLTFETTKLLYVWMRQFQRTNSN